jgi:hypothetical protein
MSFGRWYPLDDGARHAPAGPGVFQVRLATGLRDYPTGKSAMVHYQAAPDLRAAVAAFAAGHAGRGWLCRHTVDLAGEDADDVDGLCARLVRDFRARFGAAPAPTPAPAPAP